jgi:hypothetical protein
VNRRFLLLLLCIGFVLGVLCAMKAEAKDDGDIVITNPHWTACQALEPYSYWWYALYCDQFTQGVTSETVEIDADGVVTVEREYADGSRRVFTGRKVKR